MVLNVKSLHVRCPLSLSDFNETWIFSTDFQETFNVKYHQNPSSRSQLHADGQTDVKIIVALRNFASAPKNESVLAMLSNPVL
jgi:hypothetical protein